MKKKLLISCLVLVALLSAVAVAASAAGLFEADDIPASVEITTTSATTEAVTTEATTTVTTTEATSPATTTVPTTTTTAEITTTVATTEATTTEPQYTSWTDRQGSMYYLDAEGKEPGVVYVSSEVDDCGKIHWFDENGKEPHKPELSIEEQVTQMIRSVSEEQKWARDIMLEKASLTSEREQLLSGKSEADLTEAEKKRLNEIDQRLAFMHLNYGQMTPEQFDVSFFFLADIKAELEELQNQELYHFKGADTRDAVENRLRIEIYQTCLDMYDNGATIKEVLIYEYTQLDGLFDQLRAMGY